MGLPAQRVEAGAIHPLAGRTIGLGGVKRDLARVAHGLTDSVSHFGDGDITAKANVDVAAHGGGVGLVGVVGQVHNKDAGGGHGNAGQATGPTGDPGGAVYSQDESG